MRVSEKKLEDSIVADLVAAGYRHQPSDAYDRELCLDPKMLIDFIYTTQPEEWEKLKEYHGDRIKEKFLYRVSSEIKSHGILKVLRKGIRDSGCHFDIAFFKPNTGFNEKIQKKFKGNIFSVIQQLYYETDKSGRKSVDLGIFLNGIPLFTTELKEQFTGQTITNAIKQYRFTRDSRLPLFSFRRCLAHFAVDDEDVYMTTKLEDKKTNFIPLNKGRDGGAGNPPNSRGYSTEYLWKEVWEKNSLLNIIQHFIHDEKLKDEKGRLTGRKLIFPRYHQLDCVRRLIDDARQNGPGQKYLIQHSAGSGKSNSIAWLAHQLSVLHDDNDIPVFDSAIIITDRKILDKQLQRTVSEFQQTRGVVENIEKTSKQLKEALEVGKRIIITTLQKFPVILGEVGNLAGNKFAVIIDEAHSSQSGESSRKMRHILQTNSLEKAEAEESEEYTSEDMVLENMTTVGGLNNVSFFAFTATPKRKTTELFGAQRSDGSVSAFSLYSMRQAIEEGFILDVLKNYNTYSTYWGLLKTVSNDPKYDQSKANSLLRSFVELTDHAIEEKVKIMGDHFTQISQNKIAGKAKAMVVTRSRLHAVKYKKAFDNYFQDNNIPFKTVVAFSGTVKHKGLEFTEAKMNGFSEKETAAKFDTSQYRIMIVAEKFQTGFDQPKLHTMYVDKRLNNVHAVQTLSRLNRIHPPDKEETMVLDFANEGDTIRNAFQPYYDRTEVAQPTDPNVLYDYQIKIEEYNLFSDSDVDAFAKIFYNPKSKQEALHHVLRPVVDRYNSDLEEEEKIQFRRLLKDYYNLYSFMSQVVSFSDSYLEKLYEFSRLLYHKLPYIKAELPVDVREKIDLEYYRVKQISSDDITLERGKRDLPSIGHKGSYETKEEELAHLSRIIKELNNLFGTDFNDEDKVFIEHLESLLMNDSALENSVRANTKENTRLSFNVVFDDKLGNNMDRNFKLFKKINDDNEFKDYLLERLFERFYRKKKE